MKHLKSHGPVQADALVAAVDRIRHDVSQRLDPRRRVLLGQFLTPASVAWFMAGIFKSSKTELRVLDPGAGIGSLSAALVAAVCKMRRRPRAILLTAYEIDPMLSRHLRTVLDLCREASKAAGIRLEARVLDEDFLEAGAESLDRGLFARRASEQFDWAILNPPYRKINTGSRERQLLRRIGLETSNLYTGFLAITARLLAPHGEMIAITPRSFCNGPYFEPFRRFFLRDMRFRRVHVFDARDQAFADDDVLQENIIFLAQRLMTKTSVDVTVSSSLGPDDPKVRVRRVGHQELVRPDDPHAFIHIVPDSNGDAIRRRMGTLGASLVDLGLTVSTGRVVDFRAKDLLRATPDGNTVPLIYPCHLREGVVEWPNGRTRKPNALALGPRADDLLVPAGHYVLVKRFSAKEEPRRVMAAVFDPALVPTGQVAFENHLNYYHVRGGGLPATVAKGLAAFLNSTFVDSYFRQFSGHTQVNATDLRALRYPVKDTLVALGRRVGKHLPTQIELDRLVEEVVFHA